MFIIQKLLVRKKLRQQLFNLEDEAESSKRRKSVLPTRSRWMASVQTYEKPLPAHPLVSQLSEAQFKGLWVTWMHLKSKAGLHKVSGLCTKVFEKMVKRRPKMKMVFIHAAFMRGARGAEDEDSRAATVYDHGRLLAALLDTIICSHVHPDADILSIKNIGSCHAGLRALAFVADYWEIFGQSFSEVMILQDCVRAYPHASRAWNLLIAILTDRFRAQYERQIRTQSYKSLYHSAPNVSVNTPSPKIEKRVLPSTDLPLRRALRYMDEPKSEKRKTVKFSASGRSLPSTPVMIRREFTCELGDQMANSTLSVTTQGTPLSIYRTKQSLGGGLQDIFF